MLINPINDIRKSEIISEAIIEQIKSGAWPAGKRIPGENDLARQFNVSRTSIRQAISQLTGQGILTVKRGEGTFVNEVLPGDFFDNLRQLLIMETPKYLEVQEFRKIIEPPIAYSAALKASDDDIRELGLCIKNQIQYLHKDNPKAYSMEDLYFHKLLAECTKNSMVIKTIGILWELMSLAMEHTTAITGYLNGVDFHTKIYEHIKNREPEQASIIMQQHIDNNIRAVLNSEHKQNNSLG